jgi:hypothetical protein
MGATGVNQDNLKHAKAMLLLRTGDILYASHEEQHAMPKTLSKRQLDSRDYFIHEEQHAMPKTLSRRQLDSRDVRGKGDSGPVVGDLRNTPDRAGRKRASRDPADESPPNRKKRPSVTVEYCSPRKQRRATEKNASPGKISPKKRGAAEQKESPKKRDAAENKESPGKRRKGSPAKTKVR